MTANKTCDRSIDGTANQPATLLRGVPFLDDLHYTVNLGPRDDPWPHWLREGEPC